MKITFLLSTFILAFLAGCSTVETPENTISLDDPVVSEISDEEEDAEELDSDKQIASEEETKEETCTKTYTQAPVSFDYPCDWEKNVGNKETMSAVGTVVAPDGKASFHYPAPDFGPHGMTLTNEGSVRIDGKDYSTRTYEGGGETIVIIEMGTALNEYGYDLMFAYQGTEHKEELDQILKTFEF